MQNEWHLLRVSAAGVHPVHFVSVHMCQQFLTQLICCAVRWSTCEDVHIWKTLLHLTQDETEKEIRCEIKSILIHINATKNNVQYY